MGRYDKFYKDVDGYFDMFKKEVFYKKSWHVSYFPSRGRANIKEEFIKELCSKCSGNEVRLLLLILDSVPKTDNPYESGVVRIVESEWKHVLTGKPFRDAIKLFVELGFLEPTTISTRYKINPMTWCKIITKKR